MWQDILIPNDDHTSVKAQLPNEDSYQLELEQETLNDALTEMELSHLCIDEEATYHFLAAVKEKLPLAIEGVIVASVTEKDATLDIELQEGDMKAVGVVTAAINGEPLSEQIVLDAIISSGINQGLNKAALKKLIVLSHTLPKGGVEEQVIAIGRYPVQGQDTQFEVLFDGQESDSEEDSNDVGKVDINDRGMMLTVSQGQPLLKKIPEQKGEVGWTVLGHVVEPNPITIIPLKASEGTQISDDNPNILVATKDGMPTLNKNTVSIDNALCLKNISVETGHVKFKGNIVVNGNIEADMTVRATGNIIVGGFIESADVQAQGNITVKEGIIGRSDIINEDYSCTVKAGGDIKAHYTQYANVQSKGDMFFEIHALSNMLQCGGDLTVFDGKEKGGLSGGLAKVGGKVTCFNLGAEGGVATTVDVFARFNAIKNEKNTLKSSYKQVQDDVMEIVRKELEIKKTPKAERVPGQLEALEEEKNAANQSMADLKVSLDDLEEKVVQDLEKNTLHAINRVYRQVTIRYGDVKVLTKRIHGKTTFKFNQYEIEHESLMESEDEE
ncbi:FapA family protein [Vibrio sp.]|nr:FapA family protein [Vibrio sp.]